MRVVDQRQYLADNAFINAFDEFNDVNRKLFEIPEIDKFLSFSNRKNICIQNQIHGNNNFLHHIIAKICISYHLVFDSRSSSNKSKEKRTILIDAGNGNNLGSIYLNLTKLTIEKEIDINILLDSITIVRAFTFYQLANIIVNELPKFINQLGNKIQIILLDLFDTLVSSSYSMKKTKDNSNSRSGNEIEDNIGIVNELIDILISLSEKYFVILTYNEVESSSSSNSLVSKFDNTIKIKQVYENREKTVEIELLTHSHSRSQATSTINRKELPSLDMFTGTISAASAAAAKKIIINQV